MFCVEDQYSLESLDEAVKEVEAIKHGTSGSCLFYLVGNKVDLFSEISLERITEKQIELNCKKPFFISSKTGDGVDQLMDDIAKELQRKEVNSLPQDSPIQLYDSQPSSRDRKKCSC